MVKRLLIFILAAVLCSCEHKELCYSHPHTAKMRIDVDWSQFIHKEVPTGMTVMVFPQDGTAPITQLSNTTTHVYVNLSQGYYNSIAFNQSVTEFGSLQFRNMNDYETAEVYADTAPTKWYTKGDERVAAEPEWFGADRFEMAQVTPEMIEERAHLYAQAQKRSTPEYIIGTHTPLNVIYTVNITVHINGIHNLRSARGAMQGMAEGYILSQDQVTAETVTHLVEEWSLTKDPNDYTKGYIKATIQSFGLPSGHNGAPERNKFSLSLLLADNSTQLDFPLQVGDLWDHNPQNMELNLELTLPDPLPDVKPEGGSSGGFDATVEEWGDEIEHEIQM